MSEIKEQKGMMARQEETEEVDQGTGFLSSFIDDPADRKALGRILTDALTGFSTMFGSTARQLGALEEEQRIYDQRQELAAQSAAQELDIIDRENKKNAEDLKKIKARNQENKKNGFLLLSQPMFKRQLDDYRAKTGRDIDVKDPNFLINIGRAYGDLAKREGKDSALATFAKKIYVAKQDPNIKLFENYFVDSVTKSVDEQTQEALKLKKPKSLLQRLGTTPLESGLTEMVRKQKAGATPEVRETVVPDTGEVFKTLSDVEKIRMTKEQQDKLAAGRGLAIVYPEGDFSAKPIIQNRENKSADDISFFTKGQELLPFILDAGYGPTDGDQIFKDITMILESAAPEKPSETGQVEFERKVDKIISDFSKLDRFEKQARIQQLRQGVSKKTGSGKTGGQGTGGTGGTNQNVLFSKLMDLKSSKDSEISKTINSGEEVEENVYRITTRKNTEEIPAGSIIDVSIDEGKITNINVVGKGLIEPQTLEEFDAMPTTTPEEIQNKNKVLMKNKTIRKLVQKRNKEEIEKQRNKN